jgi:hypothetical protein
MGLQFSGFFCGLNVALCCKSKYLKVRNLLAALKYHVTNNAFSSATAKCGNITTVTDSVHVYNWVDNKLIGDPTESIGSPLSIFTIAYWYKNK